MPKINFMDMDQRRAACLFEEMFEEEIGPRSDDPLSWPQAESRYTIYEVIKVLCADLQSVHSRLEQEDVLELDEEQMREVLFHGLEIRSGCHRISLGENLARIRILSEAQNQAVVLMLDESAFRPDFRENLQACIGAEVGQVIVPVGGGRGIRTLETFAGLTVFKTVAIDHSAIPPKIFYIHFKPITREPSVYAHIVSLI